MSNKNQGAGKGTFFVYLGEKDSCVYNSFDMPQPATALQANQVVTHGKRPSPDHFKQLLQAGPHYVDVFNADKLEADVGVIVLVLIAFTCCSIS